MIKYGAVFTCERCGKQKFVEGKDGEVIPTPYTWASVDRSHLCPDCTERYNKMMNDFFAPEVKRPINLED